MSEFAPARSGGDEVEVLESTAPGVPTLEEIKSEWTTGASQKLVGQLRQARAAAALQRHYGKQSVASFASEMNVGASTVYEYSAAWVRLMEAFEDEDEISRRLEDSPLKIWNVIEATKDLDVPRALDEAEDEGLSSRAQREKRRESGEPQNVETVDLVRCPQCGHIAKMREVNTWAEAATNFLDTPKTPAKISKPDEDLLRVADELAEKIENLKTKPRKSVPKWSTGDMEAVSRLLEAVRGR